MLRLFGEKEGGVMELDRESNAKTPWHNRWVPLSCVHEAGEVREKGDRGTILVRRDWAVSQGWWEP